MCSPSYRISLRELNSAWPLRVARILLNFHSVLISRLRARSLTRPLPLCAQVNHEDKMISYSHPGLTTEESSSVAGSDLNLL